MQRSKLLFSPVSSGRACPQLEKRETEGQTKGEKNKSKEWSGNE